jgi:outer membrane protein assembly factor BamB
MASLLFVALAFGSVPTERDWPQWRGPNRDGVARGARLPRDWPAHPPRPVWRVEVGEGYSSPVIADGQLFIMSRQGDQEVCLCLDAATGQEKWRHAYPQPFAPHPGAKDAGLGPKSTPTVDGDRVYMLGVEGKFHCFDAAGGRVRWSRDLAAEFWGVEKDSEGYDRWKTLCGAAASPLIDGDRVILPVGGKKAGAMTAFDKHTGKIVWKALDDRSTYGSPVAAEAAGVRQIVGFTGKRMAGFAASDGRPLWDYPFEVAYDDTIVTPVVWNDLVLVCGEDRPAAALRIEKTDEAVRQQVAWQNKTLRCAVSTPVVCDGHLYGLANSGRLVCVDLATGKTAWAEGSIGSYASLVWADGQLLVLNQAGELHVLEPTPKAYAPRARLTLSEDGQTWSHLAVVGSRLYVKDKRSVLCFDFGVPR